MLKTLINYMESNQHSAKTMGLTIYILHVFTYWHRRKSVHS